MGNPYANTFMIATRMDNPRLYDFHPPAPRKAKARPARRWFWTSRR